eukprot:SAG31_NODE_4816_length_2936_cov_1.416990_2_plen_131_part_00
MHDIEQFFVVVRFARGFSQWCATRRRKIMGHKVARFFALDSPARQLLETACPEAIKACENSDGEAHSVIKALGACSSASVIARVLDSMPMPNDGTTSSLCLLALSSWCVHCLHESYGQLLSQATAVLKTT